MGEQEQVEQGLADLWFDALAQASTIGIFRTEFGRGIVWVNDRFLEIFGSPREVVLGMEWLDVVAPDDVERVTSAVASGRESRTPLRLEFRVRRPDGDTRWVRARAAPVYTDDEVIGYAGALEDLTDVVESAQEAARLAAACQATSDIIVITDTSGGLRYLNPAARDLLGRDDPTELSASDLYTESSLVRVQTEMLLALVREGRWGGDLELRSTNGENIPVSLVATLARGEGDADEHVVVVARDIRAERELAAEASRGDAQFRLLAQSAPFGIVEVDLRGQPRYVNQHYCDIVGHDADEVAELIRSGELIHPDDREVVMIRVSAAFVERRALESIEYRVMRADGESVWVRGRHTPIVDDDHGFHGFLATIEDISEEHAERASVDRLVRMLDSTPDFASIANIEGQYLFMNPAQRELFGVGPDDPLEGMVFEQHYTERSLGTIIEEAAAAFERDGVWTGEVELVAHDGRVVDVLQTTVKGVGSDGVAWYASVGRDISELKEVEARLARSEAWFRTLLQNLTDLVIVMGRDGDLIYASPSSEQILGYSPTALASFGAGGFDRIHEDDLDRVAASWEEAVAKPGGVATAAFRVRHRDGTWRWLQATLHNLFDELSVRGLVINATDVTDERKARDAQARSEAALRAIVYQSPLAIYAVDRDGTVRLWNDAAEKVFGYTADDMLGINPDHSGEPGTDVFRKIRERVLAGETIEAVEIETRRKDGTPVTVSVSAAPVRNPEAEIVTVMGVINDITVQRIAEEERRRNEEHFRALVTHASDMVAVFEPGGLVTYASPSVMAFAGLDELPDGATTADLGTFHPDDQANISRIIDDVIEQGGTCAPFTVRSRGGDDQWRWFEVVATNLVEDPAVGGIVTNARDVTERVESSAALREANEALLENEARFRALAEHASVIITILDADGKLRYTSPSVSRILGYPEGSALGINVFEILHPDDRADMQALFELLRNEASLTGSVRFRLPHAEGGWRHIEATGSNLLEDPAVRGIVITARDITEQIEAEEAAEAGEERFRVLVQNLTDIITIVEDDGRLRWTSPAVQHVLGYSLDEIQSASLQDLVHPDDLAGIIESTEAHLEDPDVHDVLRFRVRHADGSWRLIEAVVDDLRDNPVIAGLVITSRDATESLESERRLAESEARYRGIVEDQTELLCRYRLDGTLTFVNGAFARYFDKSVEELVGAKHSPFIPEDDHQRLRETLESLGPRNPTATIEHRILQPDGQIRWHEWTHRVVLDAEDRVVELGAIGRDITEQRSAEALVKDQSRILEMVARGAALPETLEELCSIVETHAPDVTCSVLLVDEASPALLRLGAAPTLPDAVAELIDGSTVGVQSGPCGAAVHFGEPVIVTDIGTDPMCAGIRQIPLAHGLRAAWSYPITAASDDRVMGTICFHSREARGPSPHDEQLIEMAVHNAAIAIERKSFESQLAHQAHHDPLTGLPNRVLFLEFLVLALARARRYQSTIAVLFLDLDRFKVINDSLGHDSGDELLVALAERLRSVLRPGDTVARFGGDEFTVLCEDLSGPQAKQQVVEVAERLLDVIHQPFLLDGEEHFLSASIGIALASGDDKPDELLRDADAAMYQAKERGKGRWEIFDESMRQSALRRLEIENALHRAIDRGEFRVFYQPCMSIGENRCVGAEALVRWQHPERGLVAPMEFIGLAEETGLVVPLGRWVLEEACRQALRWNVGRPDGDTIQVSVNISGRQLAHPDLVDHVRYALERTELDPALLCLEITESVLMEDVDTTITTLARLKDLGVALSIDDFGTGYSSLGYLKRFPVDFVKVDRSFVSGLGTDPEDSAIVAAVVSLGHALGLQVVAEGVETELHLHELEALGCDQAQGYLFAPPQPAGDLDGIVGRRSSRWLPEAGLR